MKAQTTIKLKAIFLLFVFLLNTVVGFACATGLENIPGHMHNQDEGVIPAHHHSKSNAHHHHGSDHSHSAKEGKTDCCKDEVAKLVKADKVFPSDTGLNIQPLGFFTIVLPFYQYDAFASLVYVSKPRYFVRERHPPITDVRISIQSFQI